MSGLVSGLQNRVRRFESARNLNHHFKALESQVLSRAYFLWVPIGVPIFGHRVTLHDVSIGHENILITCLLYYPKLFKVFCETRKFIGSSSILAT